MVYILIGVLAVQIAFGQTGERADQAGALQSVAEKPFGKFVLWLVVVGFAGYALWRATEAVVGHTDEESAGKRAAKRGIEAVKALIYFGLAFLAFRIATDKGSGKGGERASADLMKESGGRWLVGLIGVVLVAVAIYFVVKAIKASFADDLALGQVSAGARTQIMRLGRAGYLARGIVTAILGGLVVVAAVQFDPKKARGLDLALRELAAQPYGRWLLVAVALGLMCFGAFSCVEARFRRL
jgi:hypothetical protein